MKTLYILDLLGTMVFAISGALTASEKKLDVFGISAVAFITALGGGTLRDLLLGITQKNAGKVVKKYYSSRLAAGHYTRRLGQ